MTDRSDPPPSDRSPTIGSPHGSGQPSARDVLARAEQRWLTQPGIAGFGLGHGAEGEDIIIVYAVDEAAARSLPGAVEGIPVRVIVTGQIRPLGG